MPENKHSFTLCSVCLHFSCSVVLAGTLVQLQKWWEGTLSLSPVQEKRSVFPVTTHQTAVATHVTSHTTHTIQTHTQPHTETGAHTSQSPRAIPGGKQRSVAVGSPALDRLEAEGQQYLVKSFLHVHWCSPIACFCRSG